MMMHYLPKKNLTAAVFEWRRWSLYSYWIFSFYSLIGGGQMMTMTSCCYIDDDEVEISWRWRRVTKMPLWWIDR